MGFRGRTEDEMAPGGGADLRPKPSGQVGGGGELGARIEGGSLRYTCLELQFFKNKNILLNFLQRLMVRL